MAKEELKRQYFCNDFIPLYFLQLMPVRLIFKLHYWLLVQLQYVFNKVSFSKIFILVKLYELNYMSIRVSLSWCGICLYV